MSGVKDIVSCLPNQSKSSVSSRGILTCLGYRDKPETELVFEIPETLTEMQTLENLATAGQEFAHGIAEAVLSVHALNRVHKNIRPSNILLLKAKDTDIMQIGNPFLIDWAMLRSTDMPSSMAGEQNRLKDIYRHPRRRGLQREQRYNMGHDIYSFGVCLLVIGLDPEYARLHFKLITLLSSAQSLEPSSRSPRSKKDAANARLDICMSSYLLRA